jgi:hypothetical protein
MLYIAGDSQRSGLGGTPGRASPRAAVAFDASQRSPPPVSQCVHTYENQLTVSIYNSTYYIYIYIYIGRLGEFVSVHTNEKQLTVSISCDSGRVCRPLIIVERGVSRVTQEHIQQVL